MKVTSFSGINNVADTTRLSPGEMTAATNLDISQRGKLLSRRGRTRLATGSASSVFEAPFGIFALIGNDLMLLDTSGAEIRTVYETLGYTRVWYALLPDGRVAFSNGLIQGLASLTETTTWGLPIPVDSGFGVTGSTPYMITYVRLSDGLEGAPFYGENIDTTQDIVGLPALSGYRINVYFAPYGEAMFLAGSTITDTFPATLGQLGAQWTGHGLGHLPVGIMPTVWNSRVLVADGSTVWATRPMQPELCDLTRDFLQLPDTVTMLYGNDAGLFVGTTTEMYFMAGLVFDQLKAQSIARGRVALGSCVETSLSYLNEKVRPRGALHGALCLLDGAVHLVAEGGEIISLTSDRYRTDATEVHATVRLRDGVLHYLAAPA